MSHQYDYSRPIPVGGDSRSRSYLWGSRVSTAPAKHLSRLARAKSSGGSRCSPLTGIWLVQLSPTRQCSLVV